MNCIFCNREINNKGSLAAHQNCCSLNPTPTASRSRPNRVGKPTWNAGLTKDDLRVAALALKISASQRGRRGRPHSEETKAKISEIRKQFMLDNPDKVPYVMNHSSRQSVPEKYFAECFAQEPHIVAEYRVLTYSLDFAVPTQKVYLEIDGGQHYSDARIVQHDIKRTQALAELGWTGIRIRWSHFMKMTSEERHAVVQEVRIKMNNLGA